MVRIEKFPFCIKQIIWIVIVIVLIVWFLNYNTRNPLGWLVI